MRIPLAQCYHRKHAWLLSNSDGSQAICFRKPAFGDVREISLPCGKCVACRVNNAASWATRVYHESRYVSSSCFVTLTYDAEHCPVGYSLDKSDVQNFLKRLRNRHKIRAFFACGEYGKRRGRPHYHVILLGWCPSDLEPLSQSYSGMMVYRSRELERIWGKGYCPVGTCTQASAAYAARYAKKADSPNCGNRLPPFFLSSRNIPLSNGKQGALGAQWVIDNHSGLRFGYLRHPSKPSVKVRIPDYYFDLLERWYPSEYVHVKALRYDFASDVVAGLLVVDGVDHRPCCIASDSFDEKSLAVLEEFVGVEHGRYHFVDLLEFASDVVRRMDVAQSVRLGVLARNVE